MEEKWNKNFTRAEMILIRIAVLILLLVGLLKILGPEIRETYGSLIRPHDIHQSAPQQPTARVTGAVE